MKILHAANFSWFSSKRKRADNLARYYAPDRKTTNGLIRNGHTVWDFSYRDVARYLSPLGLGKQLGRQKMNEVLIQSVRAYRPDILMLGHSELVLPATLATLRDDLPDCKIAQWWVDPFSDYSISHLRQKLPYLDTFYATSAPSYYRPLLAADSAAIPPLYYLPNITDSSVETECAYAADKYEYDLLFIGANTPARTALLERVKQNTTLRCGFFGFGGQPVLTGAAFITVFGKGKMGLNLSRATDIPLYSSDRLAQLTGNGCLALTPRTPQMPLLFSEEEVVYYDDEDTLLELLNRYNKEDSIRRKIAEAGWRRAHASYNERRVARFMVEAAMGGEFSEPYEWLNAG